MIVSTSLLLGFIFSVSQLCLAQHMDKAHQTTPAYLNEPMLLESESKYSFPETVAKLTAEVAKKAWKISVIHDLQETLKKNGTDVLPVKVFELCHPKHSSKILLKDDERIVSSVMPCRISVYEKSNGKTYISRMNSGILAKSFGGTVESVMTEASREVEEILSLLVESK
ncbi:MAG: DUF302 domain-containing protein [Chloroherpetonaceae bacterium]